MIAREIVDSLSCAPATRSKYWKAHRVKRSDAREKIYELAREVGYRIKLDVVFLPYGRPHDNHVRRVGTVPNTSLEKLALETEEFPRRPG